jgi:hypothetical protein
VSLLIFFWVKEDKQTKRDLLINKSEMNDGWRDYAVAEEVGEGENGGRYRKLSEDVASGDCRKRHL